MNDNDNVHPLHDPLSDEYPLPTREPVGIVLGLFMMAFAVFLGFLAMQGGWWSLFWLGAVSLGLFGLVGFTIDVRKVPRDGNGRPLR